MLSPAYRRWQRLLGSLTYNPEEDSSGPSAPGSDDVIICGIPRSGTALLTAMLYRPPELVTVMEPWDAMRMSPAELYLSLRQELTAGRLSRGRLDIEALNERRAVSWCRDGEKPVDVFVSKQFKLAVKFPAFWRYLDYFPDCKFIVCVRDPAEVIPSFRLNGGRLSIGLDYDIPFNEKMNRTLENATKNEALRRIKLYDYIAFSILPHMQRKNVFVLRYEDWFERPEALLSELGEFVDVNLTGPTIDLREPVARKNVDPTEQALIKRHCKAARAFGYE